MFSRDTKDEIAGVHFERACCPASFIRALAVFGETSRSGQQRTIRVASERGSVARAVVNASHMSGIQSHLTRLPARRRGAMFVITVPLGKAPREGGLPRRRCCRQAWLRAAFLTGGSVNDPARGYHLEFSCRNEKALRLLCDTIASFGSDAGVTRRRGRLVVYIKSADAISQLLAHMGASHAVFRLEGQRALKVTKNSIRRAVNGEAANAARAAASAARQRDAALRAVKKIGWPNMSHALREAAQLRIAHPARTLRELALSARPPITKAAMASRLRLLERLTQR